MELIVRNPYRTLNLAATATDRQIAKRVNEIRLGLEMGQKILIPEIPGHLPAVEMTKELLQEAEGKLHQLQDRFFYSMFAHSYGQASSLNSKNSIDSISIEIIGKIRVQIDNYVITIIQSMNGNKINIDQFFQGIAEAGEVFSSQKFSQFMIETQTSQTWMQRVYDELYNKGLQVVSGKETNGFIPAIKLKKLIISFNNFPENAKIDIFSKLQKQLYNFIEKSITQTINNRKENPGKGLFFGKRLLANTKSTIETLKIINNHLSAEFDILRDHVAQEASQCSIDFYNSTYKTRSITKEEFDESLEIETTAFELATGSLVKDKIKQSIDITIENINNINNKDQDGKLTQEAANGHVVTVTVDSSDGDQGYSFSQRCACCLGEANKTFKTGRWYLNNMTNRSHSLEFTFPICTECINHNYQLETNRTKKKRTIFGFGVIYIFGSIILGVINIPPILIWIIFAASIVFNYWLYKHNTFINKYLELPKTPSNHVYCKLPVELIEVQAIPIFNWSSIKLEKFDTNYTLRFSNPVYGKRFAESNNGQLSALHPIAAAEGKAAWEEWRQRTIKLGPGTFWLPLIAGFFVLIGTAFRDSSSSGSPASRNVPDRVESIVPPPVTEPIRPNPRVSPPVAALPVPRPVDLPPEQPLPAHGRVWTYSSGKPLAPFKVETSGGEGRYYLIRLKSQSSGKKVLEAFIHAGQTFQTKVPLGNYMVYWASGTTWYGLKKHFGPDAQVQKSNDVFNFYADYENNRVMGHSVTLYRVTGGNMQSRTVNPSEFDTD